jgi:RNA polymerase sigma factor (sigma-70 family)
MARRFPALPVVEQGRLVELAQNSPASAERKLAVHLLTIHSYAFFIQCARGVLRRWPTQHAQSLADLVQEGALNLPIAINDFDPTRTNEFPAFARKVVSRAMFEYLRERVQLIKWDHNVDYTVSIVLRSANALRALLGREPSIDEMASHAGMSPKVVREAMILQSTQRTFLSLDSPVSADSENESVTFADIVEDEEANTESVALKHDGQRLVEEVRSATIFNPRESNVVELLYGTGTEPESRLIELLQGNITPHPDDQRAPNREHLSVRETAEELDISKSAVERANKNALEKIRQYLKIDLS